MSRGYIFNTQMALFGHRDCIGFGEDDFCIMEVPRDKANEIIVKNHYSGKFYNATYIHLGIFSCGKIKGVLQYGYAMNPASQESVVKNTKIDEYLELNRMWLDDELPKNSESRAISYSIKYIKKKYPKIKWIQSFADERCGKFGVVYQAANFEYCGEHTATFWELDGEIFHNSLMTRNPSLSKSAKKVQDGRDRATSQTLRQFRYVYFIKKQHRKNLKLKAALPPKHYHAA